MAVINSKRSRIVVAVAVIIIALAGGSFAFYQNYQKNKTHPSEPCYSDPATCHITKQDVLQMALDRGIKGATLDDVGTNTGINTWEWHFVKQKAGPGDYCADVFDVDPDTGKVTYQFSGCQLRAYILNTDNARDLAASQVRDIDPIYAVDVSNDRVR